ncbi:zona pellucida protein C [Myxocyprinus asiaticus]|uniref:zona pellucida protein C n=1 Tax=Myxocyprinus asiaticus TaxID=70543 RepID=UPI002223B314|nr:zona pellucida protein C [Myxocyprinus asiaticus]
MGMAGFFVLCCTIVALAEPVTSNENDLNGIFTSYSPGVIHVSDFPVMEDGYFINEILQPPTLDELESMFGSVFPMPYEVHGQLERSGDFSIRIMTSSWRDLANTNVFHKGEQLYLQVSASPGPGQQLYVLSCHASSSPDPADKPEVALIINKGCVASKESLVKFVYRRSDVVNLVLRTSSLKSSKVYLHCTVSLSDLGLTSNTKFCNYNKLKSRWVDLGGKTSVCECCERSCRSLSERGDLLELTAVVSTGLLIIKDQQSEPQATPLVLSEYSTSKSSPTSKDLSDRWIMAGTSFSKSSVENVGSGSPLPVQPGFGGGVMVISQGLGGALSMWLPELMELQLNPVMDVGFSHAENPAVVAITLQSDDPFRRQKPEWQNARDKPVDGPHQEFAVDEVNDGAKYWLSRHGHADVAHLGKVERQLMNKEQVHLEQPRLNFSQSSDLSDEQTPTEKVIEGTKDEGEVIFRQAEMVFKGAKSSVPFLSSKLSLKAAADGSSSLSYEEQKMPSISDRHIRTPELERDGEKRQKDEKMENASKIKDLVSSLLDGLR